MKRNIHVDAELLAAWSEGTLPKDEVAQVEVHLADCSSCQEMLAVFARTEPPPVVSGFPGLSGVEGGRTRWQWRWGIPIAAAATVAAIWVAIPESERTAQLNQTADRPLSEPAPASRSADADALARAPQGNVEPTDAAPRRDAPAGSSADRFERETLAKKVEQREAALPSEAKERDQDQKAEASTAAAAAPAAPPAASAQGPREARSFLRQEGEVISPDPLVHWRIAPEGRLERSTDGGKTWVAVTLPEQIPVTSVVAPTATTATVTLSDGRQFRTADQGKTWNLVQ